MKSSPLDQMFLGSASESVPSSPTEKVKRLEKSLNRERPAWDTKSESTTGHCTKMKSTESSDAVNHPAHYKLSNGAEVIDITENLNFCRGNAVKYICRAGEKDPEKEFEDLRKAIWYLERELKRLEKS